MIRVEKDRRMRCDRVPYFVVFLCIGASFFRILFFIAIFNGRGSAEFFNEYFNFSPAILLSLDAVNAFLVVISQIMMISSFMLIILVWKQIVDASVNMKVCIEDRHCVMCSSCY
jgi:hypothetical protein